MATIKEDYCSREIYRLLIKKGFDGEIHTSYDEEGYTQPSVSLQMAMKWLREVHHIFLSIQQHMDMSYVWYAYVDGVAKGCDRESHNNTYEEACEAACIYALKNLI